MGNYINAQLNTPLYSVERCIKDVNELEFVDRIKINRFLKTVKANYSDEKTIKKEEVLAKVYIINSSTYPYAKYLCESLKKIASFLCQYPIFNPYEIIILTDKAVTLVRPFVYQNLCDRLITRPFFKYSEKMWIIYQILKSLEVLHRYMAHGDIKLENFLITTWNFVTLSDFSTLIKPVLLYTDTYVSDFNFYFDTSGRRCCYLAPERFVNGTKSHKFHGSVSSSRISTPDRSTTHRGSKRVESFDEGENFLNIPEWNVNVENNTISFEHCELTKEMDIFSLGCVIFELMTDGKILFNLSDLVSYANKIKSEQQIIEKIKGELGNSLLTEMICSMISLDPLKRHSASDYLTKYSDVFRDYFEDLYNNLAYNLASIEVKNPDEFFFLIAQKSSAFLPKIFSKSSFDSYDKGTNVAILTFLSLCTSCSQSLKLSQSKINFLEILLKVTNYLCDDIIINRILPYIICFAEDSHYAIRKDVPWFVIKCLSSVKDLPSLEEANMFNDYIFPRLSRLVSDESVSVRVEFALSLPDLCGQALRFYKMSRILSQKCLSSSNEIFPAFDIELDTLYSFVNTFEKSFLTDSSSFVKRAYIEISFPKIESVLSRAFSSSLRNRDFLLSHAIDLLNSHYDWRLRQSFFNLVPQVIQALDSTLSFKISNLLQIGLFDGCEWVIYSSLKSIKYIIEKELIEEALCGDIINYVFPFLLHPNHTVRTMAGYCISAHLNRISLSTYYAKVFPVLKPYLRDLTVSFGNYFVSAEQLLSLVIKPLPYAVFESIVNKETSTHLLDFIIKKSTYLNEIRYDPLVGIDDIFKNAHEIQISLFNFLKSKGLKDKLDVIKILLMQDYIRSYNREKVQFDSIADLNGGEFIYSSGWTDISTIKYVDVDLSIDVESIIESKFSSNNILNSVDGINLYEPFYETSEDNIFDSFINQTVKTCLSDLMNFLRLKSKQYTDYLKSKSMVLKLSQRKFPQNPKINNELPMPFTFVSNIISHKGPINRIDNSKCCNLFATASDDCCVKIWNLDNLDVSNRSFNFSPLQTYNRMSGRINALKVLDGGYSGKSVRIACASHDTADIQIFDVETADPSGITMVGNISKIYVDLIDDGFIVDFCLVEAFTNPLLLGATLHGSVVGYDTRDKTFQETIRFRSSLNSYLTSVECDPNGCWVAAGTDKGSIVLWDYRFPSLPVRIINHQFESYINQLRVCSTSYKKIVCSFSDSTNPISIYSFDTGKEEASFYTYSTERISSTCSCNFISNNSLHVIHSCTDKLIRNWSPYCPPKSSILVPSSTLCHVIDCISYSTHHKDKSSCLETRESISVDPRLTKSISSGSKYRGPLYNFCTDMVYMGTDGLLVTGFNDGTLRIYK